MNARQKTRIIKLLLVLVLAGCNGSVNDERANSSSESTNTLLPHFGEFDLEFHQLQDGTMVTDTVYYAIPKFSFFNQDSVLIGHREFSGYVTIADFFFTECPSICPVMSSQMARIQSLASGEPWANEFKLVSFSVKPAHDSPAVLHAYGEKIGADFRNWHFLTGKAEDIYELAEDGFMLSAFPSDSAEGGIFHTDKVTLLDRDLHIRGYYDGTSTKSMDQLFHDISKLIKEEKNAGTNMEEK